eukprot:g41151.t1
MVRWAQPGKRSPTGKRYFFCQKKKRCPIFLKYNLGNQNTSSRAYKSTKLSNLNMESKDEDDVWYLGFGSNMSPAVFGPNGRTARKIEYKEALPVKVDGWELRFNLPALPFIEPGMGNICPKQGASVHGVAYRVTKKCLQKLYDSEGGQHGAYRLLALEACSYTGRRMEVFACVAAYDGSGVVQPTLNTCSKRYLGLLQDGAAHFKLDPAYQEWLRKQRAVQAPRWVKLCVFLLLAQLLPLPLLLLLLARLAQKLCQVQFRQPRLFLIHLVWYSLAHRVGCFSLLLLSLALTCWLKYRLMVLSVLLLVDAVAAGALFVLECCYPGSCGLESDWTAREVVVDQDGEGSTSYQQF